MRVEFVVSDMTCNHCVKAITSAVHEIESQALVNIDLASHKVVIEQANDVDALQQAIADEGYDVKPA